MNNALIQFEANITRVRELGALVQASQLAAPMLDTTDILRSQMVLSISALDHFVHELARLGMIQIAKGNRVKTDSYSRFSIPCSATEAALNGRTPEEWLGEVVREKHSWVSFQDPDKLADAIRLISSKKLWEQVGIRLGMSAKDVKTRLKLIVERRNKIAHEADMDPANPSFRWSITGVMVNDVLDFVSKVCEAIYDEVS
jgi:hypothetical protein